MGADARVGRINKWIVLVVAGVISAGDIDCVRTVGEAGQCNRRLGGNRRLGAPGAVVESPFVVSVTPEIRRHGGAPIERATRTHRKNGAGARVCSAWVSRDGDAVRLKTTEIQSAKSSANGRRTGAKLRRLPYLGNSHVRWGCAVEHSQVQHWINHLIAVTCSAPGR